MSKNLLISSFFSLFSPLLFAESSHGILAGKNRASGLLPEIRLTPNEETKLISFIAKKEFGGDWSKSVDWNPEEDFPSLGLGHYLWFPEGSKAPFNESFKDFIRFAYERDQKDDLGLKFPEVLKLNNGEIAPAPWSTRDAFLKAKKSGALEELVSFISNEKVRKLQLEYQLSHAKDVAEKAIVYNGEAGDQKALSTTEERGAFLRELLQHPEGVALLVHYPTFKGDGFSPKERYASGDGNKGWGFFQVLDQAVKLPDSDPRVKQYRQSYSAKTPSIAKIRVAAESLLKDRAFNDKTTLNVGVDTRKTYIKSWNSALSVYGNILN